MGDQISRQAALTAMDTWDKFGCDPDGRLVRYDDDNHYVAYVRYDDMVHVIKHLPSAQPEWNNHTVACLLAELFDDTCACNYNGIDEWLPSKCELLDSCPNPVGVACWEQYLKHRAERRTDENNND